LLVRKSQRLARCLSSGGSSKGCLNRHGAYLSSTQVTGADARESPRSSHVARPRSGARFPQYVPNADAAANASSTMTTERRSALRRMRGPMIGDHRSSRSGRRRNGTTMRGALSGESIRHEDVARVSATHDVFDATASRISGYSGYLPATPADASAVST